MPSLEVQNTTEGKRALPDFLAKDFGILELLKEEVEKSGDLYLRVALWKVLLRLPQHCDDIVKYGNSEGIERVKQMLTGVICYSDRLISAAEEEGGLDLKKHGTTEKIVRENINWMRDKFVALELNLTPRRREQILSAFSGGAC